jgi:hypothetical protein
MNQFKDAFLGREKRPYVRATTSQKCMRVSGKHNDLDNVGPSLRHHTFFEMLGNFSFGDYFKKEAIPFAWDLLTTAWQLSADRLYPTIFKGEAGIPRDEEAFGIWTKLVPSDRITELGLAENFWAMGDTGPCGRCSEIHYFRGNEFSCDEERHGRQCRGIDCSCDRFVEVWNNVFMEFDRQPDGALQPLPAPSIDTGMGLERITAVIQGKLSNYDTDLFTPILEAIGQRAGRRYGSSIDEPADVSMRVIADHLRAMTFLIADGVVPSNEWRGYVLRKIMRRAMRHGKSSVSQNRSSTISSTSSSPRCRCPSGAQTEPRRHRPRRAARKRVVRRADGGSPASRRRSIARRRPGHRSPVRRHSGCTTPSVSRSTSWRISPASVSSPSTARDSTARWRARGKRPEPEAPSKAPSGRSRGRRRRMWNRRSQRLGTTSRATTRRP